jgi:hypothetical protein
MIIQIVAYVIFTLGWSIYRARYLINKKQPKEAVIYSCLMGLCVILGSLFIAHVRLPSTTVPARLLFGHIGKIILKQ